MNGPHDLGGQMKLQRRVAREGWALFPRGVGEAGTLGLTLSCGAFSTWNIDESRHARESIPPASCLSASYYEIWTRALEVLLERTAPAPRRSKAATGSWPAPRPKQVLKADMVAGVLAKGGPCDRTGSASAVRHRRPGQDAELPTTHTRLPRYARAKVGVIEAVQAPSCFPTITRIGRNPQWVYTVVFDGAEIWGEGADRR